jgi:endonuclease/exonuclease/phosphatase family metal-dependent hydrolase
VLCCFARRYPLSSVDSFTFSSQCCRYGGRWGGRSSVCADLEVGGGGVRICSTHLESGQPNAKMVLEGTYVRERQAAELAKKLNEEGDEGQLLLLGGDMNAPLRKVDPTRLGFEHGGFADVHDELPWSERGTAPDEAGGKVAVPLDMIYSSKEGNVLDAGVCSDDECVGWSDHVPIFATIALD